MGDHGWIERAVQALLVSGAEINRARHAEGIQRLAATERLRFETLLSLVNAQTIESGALDATLGVALAGVLAVIFPLYEHATNIVSKIAAGWMIVPAAALAYGLFRITTDSPRAVLTAKLDAHDPSSILQAALVLSTGHESNREKLAGKRALLRFAVQLAIVVVLVWSTARVWGLGVIQLPRL